MRAQGIPEDQVGREIEAWRRSGWEPPSDFTRAMLAAYAARNSGAPESVVDGITSEWSIRYGPHVVARAFSMISAATSKLEARALNSAEKRRG